MRWRDLRDLPLRGGWATRQARGCRASWSWRARIARVPASSHISSLGPVAAQPHRSMFSRDLEERVHPRRSEMTPLRYRGPTATRGTARVADEGACLAPTASLRLTPLSLGRSNRGRLLTMNVSEGFRVVVPAWAHVAGRVRALCLRATLVRPAARLTPWCQLYRAWWQRRRVTWQRCGSDARQSASAEIFERREEHG